MGCWIEWGPPVDFSNCLRVVVTKYVDQITAKSFLGQNISSKAICQASMGHKLCWCTLLSLNIQPFPQKQPTAISKTANFSIFFISGWNFLIKVTCPASIGVRTKKIHQICLYFKISVISEEIAKKQPNLPIALISSVNFSI